MERFNAIKKFNIENPKNVGGIGCFSSNNIFKNSDRLFIGEAAGLQDMLWGFGMRFAITSGFLAAQSIIKNQNYEKLAKTNFNKKLKASLVNRFLWEKINAKDYYFIIEKVKKKNLLNFFIIFIILIF